MKINPYRRTAGKVASPKVNEAVTDESGKFNPRPLGNVRSDGKAVAAKTGRMFNKEGQINAYDKKEALQQISYLLQDVTKDSPVAKEAMKKESALSKAAKSRALVAAFKDPTGEGFHMIGQELLAPIKELIDYEGWARKCLRVRPLAQGEIFRLTKDVAYQTVSWVIGQDGQTPESRVVGRYVTGPEFKIDAFVDIDVSEI